MSSPQGGILPPLPKPVGYLDVIGHSHAADAGASYPDWGALHKIDSLLQPALYRQTAIGGSVHARANYGNGAGGDGGWAWQNSHYDRLEDTVGNMSTAWFYSTLSAAAAAGTNSVTVASSGSAFGNEWVVIGSGANAEIVRIYSLSGASNTTVTFFSNLVNNHSIGDPIYHSMMNVGGYQAKSELVVIGAGPNDLGQVGPRNTVALDGFVFGTNPGASRGMDPFKNALRFTISQMRCACIYPANHSSVVPGGGYAISAGSQQNSYPPTYSFQTDLGQGGAIAYSNTVNSTLTITTAPDFPGGTVAFFFVAQGNGYGGALYNLSIDGSTTAPYAGTGVLDTRNAYFVQFNSSAAGATVGNPTSGDTGFVYRVNNLSAGVHTFVWTVNTLGGGTYNSYFLGWGVEAPQPPMIFCFLDPRITSFIAYSQSQYGPRAPILANSQSTQTVGAAGIAANSGTAAGSVPLGTAVTIGTTATTTSAVYPSDTITVGSGSTKETRRIVGVDSTTTLHVDSNFVNAHAAGEPVIIGYQNADIVGGGYENPLDTQGAISVPGCNSIVRSVVSEFDQWVQTFDIDPILNPPGPGTSTVHSASFAADWVHYSDMGHALIAAAFYKTLLASPWSTSQIALPKVPNKRSWFPVYGDSYPSGQPTAGNTPTFANGWTNYYPINQLFPRTGFYKDMRTRMVSIRICATNPSLTQDQLPSYLFQLPIGYRSFYQVAFVGNGSMGPVYFEIDSSGGVWLTGGWWNATGGIGGGTGLVEAYCNFLAEN